MTFSEVRRIVLAARPEAEPGLRYFRLKSFPLPRPAEGEMLLQTLCLLLDPYMRNRMNKGPSYSAPVALGRVMEGGTVAKILTSRHPDFAEGETVLAHSGWQSHAVSDCTGLRRLDPAIAPVSRTRHSAHAGAQRPWRHAEDRPAQSR